MGIKELFKRKNKEQKEKEEPKIVETRLPFYYYSITKKVIPLINKAVKEKKKTLLAKLPYFGQSAAEGYGILDNNAEIYIEPLVDGRFALRLYVDWYGHHLAEEDKSINLKELKIDAINKIINTAVLYKIRMERPLEDLEERIEKL